MSVTPRTFEVIGPASDWDTAIRDLALYWAGRVGGNPVPYLPAAASYLGPAFRAARLGQEVIWDKPARGTPVESRWTCHICGRAVLARKGSVWGLAAEEQCEPPGDR